MANFIDFSIFHREDWLVITLRVCKTVGFCSVKQKQYQNMVENEKRWRKPNIVLRKNVRFSQTSIERIDIRFVKQE